MSNSKYFMQIQMSICSIIFKYYIKMMYFMSNHRKLEWTNLNYFTVSVVHVQCKYVLDWVCQWYIRFTYLDEPNRIRGFINLLYRCCCFLHFNVTAWVESIFRFNYFIHKGTFLFVFMSGTNFCIKIHIRLFFNLNFKITTISRQTFRSAVPQNGKETFYLFGSTKSGSSSMNTWLTVECLMAVCGFRLHKSFHTPADDMFILIYLFKYYWIHAHLNMHEILATGH
jgi:hypothetical protein